MDQRTKQSDLDRLLNFGDDEDEDEEAKEEDFGFGTSMQAMHSDDLSLYSSNENVLKPIVVEGIFGSTLKAGVAKDRYGGNDDSDEEELMTEDLEVVCDF